MTDLRRIIDEIRQARVESLNDDFRRSLGFLRNAFPIPWAYVFELVQNAIDARAESIAVRWDDSSFDLQHNGTETLERRNVEALSCVGGSTKGAGQIGFMGVGFKSCFHRYRKVQVAATGSKGQWRFMFELHAEEGDIGQRIPKWESTLLPYWDADAPVPEAPMTTRFHLSHRVDDRSVEREFEHLVAKDDLTPLAILALRGLRRVEVQGALFDLEAESDVVTVRRGDVHHRWRAFRRNFQPSREATCRLLEIRGQLRSNDDSRKQDEARTIVGLLPIGADGLPSPPERGTLYATLPTGETIPFGIHVQADWLLDLSRRGLQKIAGDPWQTSILGEIPGLLSDVLCWVAAQPAAAMRAGLRVLNEATSFEHFDDANLANQFKEQVAGALGDLRFLPSHGGALASPKDAWALPEPLALVFNGRPDRRCELLTGGGILDGGAIHPRTISFLKWIDLYGEIRPDDLDDPDDLSKTEWWEAIAENERVTVLLEVWRAFGTLGAEWTTLPYVRTAAGTWARACNTFNILEAPPDASAGGTASLLAAWLSPYLPRESQKVASDVLAAVNRMGGVQLSPMLRLQPRFELSETIARACTAPPATPILVALLHWAISRGAGRDRFIPLLATESGPRKPDECLLADPFVEHGRWLRLLFERPAVVAEYLDHPEPQRIIDFLKALTPSSRIAPRPATEQFLTSREEVSVCKAIGVSALPSAGKQGLYRIIDRRFPLDVNSVSQEAMARVLAAEHLDLRALGTKLAEYSYRTVKYEIIGSEPASWIAALESAAWVPTGGGARVCPLDALLSPDDAYVDSPVADLEDGFKETLRRVGIRFGHNLAKSPALRRIQRLAGRDGDLEQMAELIREALDNCGDDSIELQRLQAAIRLVLFRGHPFDRLVKRTGSGSGLRGQLGGWVISYSDLPTDLSAALDRVPQLDIPATTTGRQALLFLRGIWENPPKNLEECRQHLPLAWRYVREDVGTDRVLENAWLQARPDARFFAGKLWRPLGPDLVVNDLDSPAVIRLIDVDNVLRVTPGHLGEDAPGVAATADFVGLRRVSAIVRLVIGRPNHQPTVALRVSRLVDLVASAMECDSLRVELVESIHFRLLTGRSEPITGIVEDGRLIVAGAPEDFAEEATTAVLSALGLSQRAEILPSLTMAMAAADDGHRFETCGRKLAVRLEVDWDRRVQADGQDDGPPNLVDSDQPIATAGGADAPTEATGSIGASTEVEARAPVSSSASASAPSQTGSEQSNSFGVRDGRRIARSVLSNGESRGGTAAGERDTERPHAASRAPGKPTPEGAGAVPQGGAHREGLNQLAVYAGLVRGNGGNGTEPFLTPRDLEQTVPRSDAAGRSAVLTYERLKGRLPEEMPNLQPGYDVLSVDPKLGRTRRIEVKSMQDDWVGDASVMATHRQLVDALRCDSPDIEYWLYVVDRINSAEPRVYPIRWTHDVRLSLGFFAAIWRRCAKEPAALTKEGLRELSGDGE